MILYDTYTYTMLYSMSSTHQSILFFHSVYAIPSLSPLCETLCFRCATKRRKRRRRNYKYFFLLLFYTSIDCAFIVFSMVPSVRPIELWADVERRFVKVRNMEVGRIWAFLGCWLFPPSHHHYSSSGLVRNQPHPSWPCISDWKKMGGTWIPSPYKCLCFRIYLKMTNPKSVETTNTIPVERKMCHVFFLCIEKMCVKHELWTTHANKLRRFCGHMGRFPLGMTW